MSNTVVSSFQSAAQPPLVLAAPQQLWAAPSVRQTVQNSLFASNSAPLRGGCLLLFGRAEAFDMYSAEVLNSTFSNCAAAAGGAISLASPLRADLSGNSFVGNAAITGGAILMDGPSITPLNSSDNSGGRWVTNPSQSALNRFGVQGVQELFENFVLPASMSFSQLPSVVGSGGGSAGGGSSTTSSSANYLPCASVVFFNAAYNGSSGALSTDGGLYGLAPNGQGLPWIEMTESTSLTTLISSPPVFMTSGPLNNGLTTPYSVAMQGNSTANTFFVPGVSTSFNLSIYDAFGGVMASLDQAFSQTSITVIVRVSSGPEARDEHLLFFF